jgi:hypothetical protein
MKKLLTGLFLICILGSCKKDKDHCYQCDIQGNGTYQDVGCMSDDEWKSYQVTDNFGNSINKETKCRKK